jgi:hypothetical protein
MIFDDQYFRDMYAHSSDPWNFQDRWYEQRRYALTLAALRKPSYRGVYELGCSIGLLSEALAPRAPAWSAPTWCPKPSSTAKRLARQAHVHVA